MHDSAQIFTCVLGIELGAPACPASISLAELSLQLPNFILQNLLRQSKSLVSKKPLPTREAS